jgi:ssDNA-binding Zn-finger/Zn-ribbon topoisomerase 1
MATCPECEFDEVDTTDLEEGDALSCPECGKGLVVSANGELDFADDEDDDLDDDDDDEDDDDDVDEDDALDDDDETLDDEDE